MVAGAGCLLCNIGNIGLITGVIRGVTCADTISSGMGIRWWLVLVVYYVTLVILVPKHHLCQSGVIRGSHMC